MQQHIKHVHTTTVNKRYYIKMSNNTTVDEQLFFTFSVSKGLVF